MSGLAELHLFGDGLDEAIIVSLRGREAISELSRFEIEILLTGAPIDLASLLKRPVALGLSGRAVPLVVTRAVHIGREARADRYALTLRTDVHALAFGEGYEVHLDKTVPTILAEVLKTAGVTNIHFRLRGRYAIRSQTVRYAETIWDFVERLAAEEGLSYWFDESDGERALLFGDSEAAHEALPGDARIPYRDPSGLEGGHEDSFFALERIEEMAPTRAEVRDYDPRHPTVLVEGSAGEGGLEHFQYPAKVLNLEAASRRAEVRLEQLQRHAVRLLGASGAARIRAGRVVQIDDAGDALLEGAWLVTSVAHRLERPENGQAAVPYRNEVTLAPADRPYRPEVSRKRPRVHGVETAMVTGAKGEEIHVDDLGRVKVAHVWDPSAKRDDTSSRWAPSLQWNMAGAMALPRMNQEVAVAYVDGDPDEPIVLGQLWNGRKRPPYPLPGAKATSTWKSPTSPFDGSNHEIRMGDTAGSEELFVNAPNTHGVFVGGSASNLVGGNQAHDVKGGLTVGLGSQSLTVGGDQMSGIGADQLVKVGGARSVSVGGSETLGTAASAELKTGSYRELIGGLYLLRCNSSFTTVQGGHLQLVCGGITLACGLGTHHSVAAARTLIVAGARNIVARSDYVDSVMGSHTAAAGVCSETAGTIDASEAAGALSLNAASLSVRAGGAITLQGSEVTIKCATLKADGGSSFKAAGSIKASGGTAKVDASATKQKSHGKAGA